MLIIMEDTNELYREPKYTMRWLVLHTVYVLLYALGLAVAAHCIDQFALDRQHSGLLLEARYNYLSESIAYCFALFSITFISLSFIEVAFRKEINYIHYGLIGLALCLFNLLLLAMSEHVSFWISYAIVTVMTVALISWFVNGITKVKKATLVSTAILVVEYGIIFALLRMGSMALLIGSLTLFVLIAIAMFFTLKLKVENQELVLK